MGHGNCLVPPQPEALASHSWDRYLTLFREGWTMQCEPKQEIPEKTENFSNRVTDFGW